jgi:hypothetical protein
MKRMKRKVQNITEKGRKDREKEKKMGSKRVK